MGPTLLQPDLPLIDVAFVCSVASIVGAAFIIGNWCCNREARRLFFLRLVVFQSVANLLSSASYILSFIEWRALPGGAATSHTVDENGPQMWCLIQALLMVVSENASILWTVAIALSLHQQVVARRPSHERLERYYHLLCWGVPILTALALLLGRMLGQSDAPERATWCWIAARQDAGLPRNTSSASFAAAAAPASFSSAPPAASAPPSSASSSSGGALAWPRLLLEQSLSLQHSSSSSSVPFISRGDGADNRWVQVSVFYLPLLLAFALNVVIYVRVGRTFRRMARSGSVDAAKERVIQLRFMSYLLVFLAVWFLPLLHRTLELAGYDPQWLRLAHTATQCSMGWLNGLVYGCNEKTLKPYREALGCSLFRGIQLSPSRRNRQPACDGGGCGNGGGGSSSSSGSGNTASLLGSSHQTVVHLRFDDAASTSTKAAAGGV